MMSSSPDPTLLRAVGGWFGMEVILDDLAHLGVTDLGGNGRPILQRRHLTSELEESGFGIALVEELALTIGVHGSPDLGHTVWADLDLALKADQPVREEAVVLVS